jgi:branched-chain amino acid transport system substrate-binding protein
MFVGRITARVLIAALVLALAAVPLAGTAEDPIVINAIMSLTGGIAFVGKEGATSLVVAQDTVNRAGGINGRPIKIVIEDDQSNPQVAVQLATKMLNAGAQVILGPVSVAACNAILPLTKAKAVDYCMSAAFYPPAHSYAFGSGVSTQNQLIFDARYARSRGWLKWASITTTDSSGQAADKAMSLVMSMPENKSLSLVAAEHFNPGDLTVSAQMARIKASGAQVFYTSSSGTPLGTILHGYTDLGLDLPLITFSGALNLATVTQYASILPKEFLVGGVLSDAPEVIPNGPERAAVRVYTSAFKTAGMEPDHDLNVMWDPTMIVVAALRKYGPNATAAQIDGYIESLHDWPGTVGRYDFRNGNPSGLEANDLVMVRWTPERHAWVAVPGQKPGHH